MPPASCLAAEPACQAGPDALHASGSDSPSPEVAFVSICHSSILCTVQVHIRPNDGGEEVVRAALRLQHQPG